MQQVSNYAYQPKTDLVACCYGDFSFTFLAS